MRDKKLSPKLLIVVGAVVALAILSAVVWANRSDGYKPNPGQSTTTTRTGQSEADPKLVSYDGVDGKDALELLKANAVVVTKDSAYGEYVDSVNGVVGGTDGKYWAFYINGQLSQVGAADYQTKAGDKIEWKFE